MWCWDQYQLYHMTKSHVAPHFNCLYVMNGILLSTSPLASWDVNANGVMQWKEACWSTFWSCYVTNAIMPLKMLLASQNSNNVTIGVTWWIKSCCTSFLSSSPKIQWCHLWCHGYYVTLTLVVVLSHDQKSCWTLFQLSWTNNCSGFIDGGVSVRLCQYQSQ